MPTGNSFSPIPAPIAIRALKRHGWSEERTAGDHVIFGKSGNRPISLRQLGGLTHDTVKIIERAIGKRIYESQGRFRVSSGTAPLSVLHKERTYAYVGEKDNIVTIQDLENGARFTVPKWECQFFYEEELPQEEREEREEEVEFRQVPEQETQAQEVAEEPATATSPPVRYTPLTNNSDVVALIRLTQRRAEALNVEYEQALGRLEEINTRRAATLAFLESLGVSQSQTVEPKRTVLPPSSKGSSQKRITTKAEQDKIRMMSADGKSAKEIAQTLGISEYTVYGWRQRMGFGRSK